MVPWAGRGGLSSTGSGRRARAPEVTATTRPQNGRRQSGDGLGRPKQAVQKWRRPQRVGPGDYRRTRKWQYMQCGVLPQAKRMCARVRVLVHQPGVSVIQMQSLVIVVVVTVALGVDRDVVQLGHPVGRSPGGEQRSRLPDDSQHQQEGADRAGHAMSLAALPPVNVARR